jgi:hypothetical protein
MVGQNQIRKALKQASATGNSTMSRNEALLRQQKPQMFQPLTKEKDVLDVDPPLPDQVWGCFSFVTDKTNKSSIAGFKSRGHFGSREEAQNYANFLRDRNNTYHVFVGQIGYWLPFDPNPENCQDQIYLEQGLNEIMTGYLKKQSADAVKFEERKFEMMTKAIYDGTEEGQEKLEKEEENVESLKFRHDSIVAKVTEYKEQMELIPKRLIELEEQLVTEKAKLDYAIKRKEIEDQIAKENETKLKERLAALSVAPSVTSAESPESVNFLESSKECNVSTIITEIFDGTSTHPSERPPLPSVSMFNL